MAKEDFRQFYLVALGSEESIDAVGIDNEERDTEF